MAVLDDLSKDAALRLWIPEQLVLHEDQSAKRVLLRVDLGKNDVDVIDLRTQDEKLRIAVEDAGALKRVTDDVDVRTHQSVDVHLQHRPVAGVDAFPSGAGPQLSSMTGMRLGSVSIGQRASAFRMVHSGYFLRS